jgi:hypothetical protein
MPRMAVLARHNVAGERTITDFERVDNDWYVEPMWVVRKLLAACHFEGEIHDPCCGQGTIPQAAHNAGYVATGADIVDRGYAPAKRLDFMTDPHVYDNIIFNPPYKFAEQFIHRAMIMVRGKIAVIVNIKFLASQGRYDRLFQQIPPAEVFICSRRPSMPPGGGAVEAKGGTADYCWIVWDMGKRPRPETTQMKWLI